MNLSEKDFLDRFEYPDPKMDKAREALKHVKFPTLPWDLHLTAYYGIDPSEQMTFFFGPSAPFQHWLVVFANNVKNSRAEGDRNINLAGQFALDPTKIEDPKYIQEAAFKAVSKFLDHEIREAYEVDGIQTKDPHKGPQPQYWKEYL